ncbi:unnamed protein product [Mytilus coruscus]|uniref:Uncharacterized protein n=1 Tax=Mytilus coruscus TaxID=42192 RepID=A0A6J8BWD7_MYTCO|nr:unnamed protein product [Mytilus coruscus]
MKERTLVSWGAYHAEHEPIKDFEPCVSALLPFFEEEAKSVAMIKHSFDVIKTSVDALNPDQNPTRGGDLEDFFAHENNINPPALSQNGKMRLGTKSDLLIIDGAAIVKMLKPSISRTFDDYADLVFCPYIKKQLETVTRVDIDNSLKAATRSKRGKGIRRRVQGQNKIPQNWQNWQSFLRDDDNKKELFSFLSQQLAQQNFEKKKTGEKSCHVFVYCLNGLKIQLHNLLNRHLIESNEFKALNNISLYFAAEIVKNVQEIDREFSFGNERKAMAFSTINTVCALEDFLSPAPASVAILGQLMTIATKNDFSIAKHEPKEGFKYVKHSDSFRACLVQISTSGCYAFTNAHTNMDKIRLYTMQFQGKVKDLVKIMLQGSSEDTKIMAPIFLHIIKKQAKQCLKLAKNTQSDFTNLTELLIEVSLAATSAKGLHEEQLSETIHQRRILKYRQELVQHQQAEVQREKDEIIEKVSAAKAVLEKSENEMHGPLKMMFIDAWDQGLKCVSTCLNVLAISKLTNPFGVAAVLVKGVRDLVSTNSGEGRQKEHDSKALTTALKYASELYVFNKYLQEKIATQFFQEPTEEDESTKNRKEVKQFVETSNQKLGNGDIEWIHERLETIVKELTSSDYVGNKNVQATLKLCKRIIAACLRATQTAWSDDKQRKFLLTEIDSILKETETLKTLSDQFFSPGAVSRLKNSFEASNERRGLNQQQVTDSVMYKIESKKQELEYMRKKQEAVKEMAQKNEQTQSKILKDLLKTDLQKINFVEIIDTLSKGMHALGELDEQWNMLVLFFSVITNRIDICLHQQTDTLKEIVHTTGHQINAGNKEIILEIAASIHAVAYSVGLLAETYTDISAKHLVQTTAGLIKMIALHPERDEEELNLRRKELNENCVIAQQQIHHLAAERREMALKHVREQFEKIKLLESKMPAIEEERKKKISEDVAKSIEPTEEDESTKNRKEVKQFVETSKQKLGNGDIEWIHERLETIVKELTSSDYVGNKNVQATLNLCKRIIAACLGATQTAWSDDKQRKFLSTEIDSILKETETLKTLSDQFFSV